MIDVIGVKFAMSIIACGNSKHYVTREACKALCRILSNCDLKRCLRFGTTHCTLAPMKSSSSRATNLGR